ncbi:DUF1304 domain-containing protein [Microbacterium halotolerans]|uniref:DUF1304 domain-containing protein n=1 Tax=Microbacterium halotolerans TaxID=246613 RepID=UPI000E6A9C87|nr:DUF1304 domain-containing protein [Microbacterium halotolerans]
MIIAGFVVAALAALLHVFIFYLESVAWESPRAMATFGTVDAEAARATKQLAFNQGFYNLFLALLAIGGAIVALIGFPVVGVTLTLAGTGSMFAAALVLFVSSSDHRGAALKQGTLPLIAVVVLSIGLIL